MPGWLNLNRSALQNANLAGFHTGSSGDIQIISHNRVCSGKFFTLWALQKGRVPDDEAEGKRLNSLVVWRARCVTLGLSKLGRSGKEGD